MPDVLGALALGILIVFVLGHRTLGAALADRIRGGSASSAPALAQEVAQLREQVDRVQADLNETQERLDFAERLLGDMKRRHAIPGRDKGA